MDPNRQHWYTVTAASRPGVDLDDVWMNYLSMGGSCGDVEVAAYLHGLLLLDPLERDLIAHAVNELLDDTASTDSRAPYSTEAVALASGYAADSFAGEGLDLPQGPATPEEAEVQRLDSLRQTGLLDTSAEERFDRLTRRAKERFGVSSASIALIGAEDQFIKSLSGPIGQNVPREISFCNETIRFARTLVVPDALLDQRFTENPLVLEAPHIRFYAGYPLTGPGGWRIGTLCVIDDKPREFTRDDEEELRALAGLVQLELAS
ncbi:GAF domain-containing protein [Arthrobacter sp. Br18]|uniref:GAF domain-containing protein n=1 Tax=Arthrobacter sp. Br18 TaxID=1312954 RepID=UPI0006884F1A|nr:GAF domain-containing protein [Arthrobacter sp. Br18]